MGDLQVSDEVRALVPTTEIAAALTHSRTTELDCADCHAPILPESPEATSLIITRDRGEHFRHLQFAHGRCSPSQVRVLDAEMTREDVFELLSGDSDITFMGIRRSAPQAARDPRS